MFFRYIIDGFKDLYKNKIQFLALFLGVTSLIMIIGPSYSSWVFNEYNFDFVSKYTFDIVPLSDSKNKYDERKNEMFDIISKYGNTTIMINDFQDIDNLNITVLIGDIVEKEEDRIIYMADKKDSDKIFKEFGKDFEVIDYSELNIKDLERYRIDENNIKEFVFLKPVSSKYKSLNSDLKGLDIVGLMENLVIDTKHVDEKVVDSFVNLSQEGKFAIIKNSYNGSDDIEFLIKYIFVYIILIIMEIILFFYFYNNIYFVKMRKTYLVHIYSGATLKGLFIRNSIFIDTVIVASWILVNYLNHFQKDGFTLLNSLILIIWLVFKAISYIMLKREFGRIFKWRVE